jgi:hypothetical protein
MPLTCTVAGKLAKIHQFCNIFVDAERRASLKLAFSLPQILPIYP